MKKKEPIFDKNKDLEKELEQERGREIVCTCNEDPDWCELHNIFG